MIERYELPARITANQNLILMDIEPSWKADIVATLGAPPCRSDIHFDISKMVGHSGLLVRLFRAMDWASMPLVFNLLVDPTCISAEHDAARRRSRDVLS